MNISEALIQKQALADALVFLQTKLAPDNLVASVRKIRISAVDTNQNSGAMLDIPPAKEIMFDSSISAYDDTDRLLKDMVRDAIDYHHIANDHYFKRHYEINDINIEYSYGDTEITFKQPAHKVENGVSVKDIIIYRFATVQIRDNILQQLTDPKSGSTTDKIIKASIFQSTDWLYFSAGGRSFYRSDYEINYVDNNPYHCY